jgi:Flp pilus assembly pilin Flp
MKMLRPILTRASGAAVIESGIILVAFSVAIITIAHGVAGGI